MLTQLFSGVRGWFSSDDSAGHLNANTAYAPERAAHIAWRTRALCLTGVAVRSRGSCIGLLKPAELDWSGQWPDRVMSRQSFASGKEGRKTRAARLRAVRHMRLGHDAACLTLGVPAATLEAQLVAWGNPQAASLMRESIEACVHDISQLEAWEAELAAEYVCHHIGLRITPKWPPNPSQDAGGHFRLNDQMPRFASKAPSSRRFFT